MTVLKALDVGKEDYVALLADNEKENNLKKFQETMKGCSEAE